MRIRMAAVVVAAGLFLTGCPDDDDGATTTTTGGAAATTATTAGPATTESAPSTTTTVATAAIVLEPDGLGVVSFGASKAETISALSAVLGEIDETGIGCELAGPDVTTARWAELSVQFVGDTFDSYTVRGRAGADPVLGLETEAGIGVGDTVADLQDAYGDRLSIPGLPPEFGGNDFAVSFPGTDRQLLGTLTGTSPGDTVTSFLTQLCE